ncbi:hypothetical protein C8R45DRAFT_970114 [Mycena sanguinolenta]|nr:hypothetical protein C8R45DRAFT_970114 [Mycena sanguinolenta]
MPFAALGDDILLNILALCDVYTVLAVSAIDTHLRDLTQAKQLWLSLLQESTFRDVLELRPPNSLELQHRSTRELVDLVKRAVIGPPPWWPGGPSATRTPSYTIAFDTGLEIIYDYRLLPGARCMVLGGASAAGKYLAKYLRSLERSIHLEDRKKISDPLRNRCGTWWYYCARAPRSSHRVCRWWIVRAFNTKSAGPTSQFGELSSCRGSGPHNRRIP